MVMISLGHNCPGLARCLPASSWLAFHCGSKQSQKSSTSQNNSSKLISRSLRWVIEAVDLAPILTHRNRVCLSRTHVRYEEADTLRLDRVFVCLPALCNRKDGPHHSHCLI